MKRICSFLAVMFAFVIAFSCVSFGVYATGEDEETTAIETTEATPQLASPVMSSVTATADGVQVNWKAVDTAVKYSVFRKEGNSGFAEIGTALSVSYTDKTASSGKTYTYKVRCLDAEGKPVSDFSPEKSIKYIKAPVITKFTNKAKGTLITWSKHENAAKYRIAYLDGNGKWTKLATVKTTSYTHENLSSGKTYLYRVRAIDSKGNYVGVFDVDGSANLFLTTPKITSVSNINGGVKIKWNKLNGASGYRVYRKEGNSDWTAVGTAEGTSFVDKKAVSGKTYAYTVRCLDNKGNLVSGYNSGKSIKYVKAPVITKYVNTATGTKITWTKCAGAAKYRISFVNSKGKWQKLAVVSSTSFTHEKLTTGKTYTYAVRCLDSKGNLVSAYNNKGASNTFIAPPVISSVSNVNGGVKIAWKKLSGVDAYRVLKKAEGDKSWTAIGTSKGTSFTDKNVASGKKYTYALRCLDAKGNFISSNNSGKSVTYIKAPTITKFSNTATGTKITWTKCEGASKYKLSVLGADGKWQKVAVVKATSYTHQKLKADKSYTYTVRCLDNGGKKVSAPAANKTNLFIAPPAISSVSGTEKGNLIRWSDVNGASGYRILRKTIGGSFERIADVKSGTSYVDTSADAKSVYSYTLRCLDSKGNPVSYYISDTKYYLDGKPANGTVTVGKNKYYFNNGLIRNGLQTINGKKYYYNTSGLVEKNGIVGSAKDGWYYADKNGVIDFNYVNGITQNGVNWIVSNGKATKAETRAEMTLFRAAKEVAKATDTTMTKSQKLKACFDYTKRAYRELNPRIPHYRGMDWPIVYANDMFIDGAGNCFSYGAAFAFMAKAIGYENVYCCHSGGHGWAEIDGKVYDPEWSRHRTKYTYYALDYNDKTDQNYKGAIARGLPWMHVKI